MIAVWAMVSFDSPVITFNYLLFPVLFSPSHYANYITSFPYPSHPTVHTRHEDKAAAIVTISDYAGD